MKILVAGVAAVAVVSSVVPADARRGGFLSALVRGGAQGAARAGVHSGVHSYGGIKTYGPETLTVEQIEKCIGFAKELDISSADVDALADAIEAEGSAIERAQQTLSHEKGLVDRYSERSVNSFNAKLEAMRQRISTHNANVDRAKQLQAGHNSSVGSYNAECAKKYYADDMEAAKLKLGVKVD